jgi:oligosaccharide repeat unit polymerase
MIYVSVASFALLLLVNVYLFKSAFAPSVQYCAVWTAGLLALLLVGNSFYPIGMLAQFAFIVGAASFTLGAVASGLLYEPRPPEVLSADTRGRIGKVLDIALALSWICAPFFVLSLVNEYGTGDIVTLLREIRFEDVEASGESHAFSLIRNIPGFAQYVTILSIFVYDGTWRSKGRIAVGILLWGVLAVFSGSKLIALQLPFFVAIAFMLRSKLFKWSVVVGASASFILAFLAGIYFLNYGYVVSAGGSVDVGDIFTDFSSYLFGGLVGFGEYFAHAADFVLVQSPLRTPKLIINGLFLTLGYDKVFDVGSLHAPFVALSDTLTGNVYTALYSFYGAGEWIGVITWSFVAGAISQAVAKAATRGAYIAFVLYAWVSYAAILSPYAEQLFSGLSGLSKAVIFAYVVRWIAERMPKNAVASRLPYLGV